MMGDGAQESTEASVLLHVSNFKKPQCIYYWRALYIQIYISPSSLGAAFLPPFFFFPVFCRFAGGAIAISPVY